MQRVRQYCEEHEVQRVRSVQLGGTTVHHEGI